MSGTKGSTIGGNGNDPYHNLVYVLAPFGSCASSFCAEAVIDLPTVDDTRCSGCPGEVRAISVTSLAAGYVGQTPYLAVGLTDGGVLIFDVSNQSSPRVTATFTGMAVGGASQTPPTALAWDPSGSGLLAIGGFSRGNLGFVVQGQRRRNFARELGDVVPAGHDGVGERRAVGGVRAARRWQPGGGVRDE